MSKRKFFNFKPTQLLILGFMAVIFTGALLLDLPISSNSGQSVGFVNALFTSTSAVCVTGLAVVVTQSHWTLFGKTVIMFLIQVGGLGFMTIAMTLFMILGRKISLKERLIMQEAMNQYTLAGMVRLTKNVILGTFLIEGVGALLFSLVFVPEYGLYGVYMSIFHSVSAFCNAGFDIVGPNGMVPYAGNVIVTVTIMVLIILGGLGFSVWIDVIKVSREARQFKLTPVRWFKRCTLHTKLVLVITAGLIFGGALFFFILEGMNPGTLGDVSLKDKILGSFFQSVTSRTAGFNTVFQAELTDSSKFMTILLMFIGGSPASTAGGIKTATFGVLFFAVVSFVKGRDSVEIYNKRVPFEIVQRSLAILAISLTVVITVTMALSITEGAAFMDVFFESVSAFGTVGLTLGLTPELTTLGKLLLSMTMFFGRLGPFTIMVALTLRSRRNNTSIVLPEEKVMVG